MRAEVPHTSFFNQNSTTDDEPRESIEVRALVFYEESRRDRCIERFDGQTVDSC